MFIPAIFLLAIFLCSSLAWLLYETKWLTIRLPAGQLPRGEPNPVAQAVVQPQRNRVMEAIIYPVATIATAGMREAIVYLLAIVAAEVITAVTVQPLWGMVFHIIVLVAVIVHSALVSDHRLRQLLLSLALVPLVRIMSLSMPLANIPQIWWFPVIYIPLLAAGVMVMHILGYS